MSIDEIDKENIIQLHMYNSINIIQISFIPQNNVSLSFAVS